MCSRSANCGQQNSTGRWQGAKNSAKRAVRYSTLLALVSFPALVGWASNPSGPSATPSIFSPASTPAHDIYHLSLFVMAICLAIFLVVFGLIVYAAVKFRSRVADDGREPPQIYGSNQVELAWTVIPILIVVVLFLASARVIHAVEDAQFPADAIEVTAVGHQFWWEFQYPGYGFITANELHVPLSDPNHPRPTHITLLSADTDHSFWVPQLAGKVDLIPNRKNEVWVDPHETGTYVGQCAQYCGVEHAKMLLTVDVQSPEEFERWTQQQKSPAMVSGQVAAGRQVFESNACVNCHTVTGTVANGKFGPDLTHLMSRSTIAAGAATNTQDNLRLWVKEPDAIKPGALMPAMQLEDRDVDALVAYLMSLH
jgi:cytochrome c oxidase subunit 2